MEPYEYATMAAFEDHYWWYRGLHGVIADLLHDAGVGVEARILDAGCGTGGNLVNLRRSLGVSAHGFDYSPTAVPFWMRRGLRRCAIASVNEMPYPSNSFDVVISSDVLEIEAVDEEKAVAEMCRVLRPGGVLLLIVPAYRWLASEEHHQAIHAVRRYRRSEVVALLRNHAIEVVRATYLFGLLFPAIAAYRLALRGETKFRTFSRPSADAPRSELKPLPKPINEALSGVMRVERGMVRNFDLPFGSSILVLGKKLGS